MILRSRKLSRLEGVRHAFSTRLGGVSQGPGATLNLGRDIGDEATNVETNRKRFATMAGLEHPIVQVQQVHEISVLEVDSQSAETLALVDADGLWTAGDRPVGIRVADCAPLLFVSAVESRARAVAAVHAGWRGAVAGIVGTATSMLEQAGFAPESLWVAIGPTIGHEIRVTPPPSKAPRMRIHAASELSIRS